MKLMFVLFAMLATSTFAHADYYGCSKMVYKDGWFRTYEKSGQTWGANTKKHGIVSSIAGSSVEKTTALVDPGVTTGRLMSSVQYSSSWGECSAVDILITREMRQEYIEQNMGEIKKQIALGQGHHVDSLAYLSGCKGILSSDWSRGLQSSTAELYDIQSANQFAGQIDAIVAGHPGLKGSCTYL